MANQDILLSLVLDRLDRVDHTHILTLLESNLSEFKFDELEALLAKHFEELLTEAICNARHLDGLLVLMAGQVLQEVPQVALIRVVLSPPLVQVGVSRQILASYSVSAGV